MTKVNDDLREVLVILQEECGEVVQEICKIMRFGPDQCKPNSDETNIQYLQKELGDLTAMIELLVDLNVGVTNEGMNEAKMKKFQKLKQWSDLQINK
jgi:NTP pyrophosphatase (non-canonical NTP hydrolase)